MKKIKGQIRFSDMRRGEVLGKCLLCGHVAEIDISQFPPGDRLVRHEYLACSACGVKDAVYFQVTRLPDLGE
ncbi:hypothetical protein [Rhodoligotrophos defluvii]|uniref:hypothetical protein n=1 Tax=Rhodoligotrophos defluvii TaxID=2561934 RepID=UPI0010C9A66D|nr:hypothetical protein [Rhodoligotrophos defluvii]